MANRRYVAEGVEEVLDAFDDFSCYNSLGTVVVMARDVEEARNLAYQEFAEMVKKQREGQWSSGSYFARVEEIRDDMGRVVYGQNLTRTVPGY